MAGRDHVMCGLYVPRRDVRLSSLNTRPRLFLLFSSWVWHKEIINKQGGGDAESIPGTYQYTWFVSTSTKREREKREVKRESSTWCCFCFVCLTVSFLSVCWWFLFLFDDCD